MASRVMTLEIQRMSTEDGPGLRTTVFLKGCSLDCSWCHNPESISSKRELIWHDWKCIACRTCIDVCPDDALVFTEDGVALDRERCQECYSCTKQCPALALEVQGKRLGVEELLAEVRKDRTYYEVSGGGVTVSGGEPGLQADLVGAFFDRCREEGIHTALDTCGHCGAEKLLELAAKTDLVLFDLKELDSTQHREHTGKGNEKILENLRALAEMLRTAEEPPQLWIRTPLIPGATATAENIKVIGELIASDLGAVVARWELCAFNNLCRDKYRRLGREWDFAAAQLLTDGELREFADIAVAAGVSEKVVVATGMTRGAAQTAGSAASSPELQQSLPRGGVS